jgi:hypothetical protein
MIAARATAGLLPGRKVTPSALGVLFAHARV